MKIILYSNANKIHFCFKGFLLSLVFKVRVSGTPKWPNNLGCTCLTFLPCSSVDVKHDHWSTSMCLTPDTSELWVTAATLKMREKNKNKRYAYLSSRIEVSGSVYCRFLSLNSKTFTVIASLNCFKINKKWRVNTSNYTIIISTLEPNKPKNSLPRTRSWGFVTRSCPTKGAW